VVADAGCKVDRLVEDPWSVATPLADHRRTVDVGQTGDLTLEWEDGYLTVHPSPERRSRKRTPFP